MCCQPTGRDYGKRLAGIGVFPEQAGPAEHEVIVDGVGELYVKALRSGDELYQSAGDSWYLTLGSCYGCPLEHGGRPTKLSCATRGGGAKLKEISRQHRVSTDPDRGQATRFP